MSRFLVISLISFFTIFSEPSCLHVGFGDVSWVRQCSSLSTFTLNQTFLFQLQQQCDWLDFLLAFHGFIDSTAEEVIGNREREREWHAAKGPGPRVEPGSAAARTKPLHMGYSLPYKICIKYRSHGAHWKGHDISVITWWCPSYLPTYIPTYIVPASTSKAVWASVSCPTEHQGQSWADWLTIGNEEIWPDERQQMWDWLANCWPLDAQYGRSVCVCSIHFLLIYFSYSVTYTSCTEQVEWHKMRIRIFI